MKIKLNLVAEIEAPNVMMARRKLDAFRESVLPTQNYGICLYEDQSEKHDPEWVEGQPWTPETARRQKGGTFGA